MSGWNHTFWKRTLADARLVTAASSAVLFGFAWLFVFVSSLIELGAFGMLLAALPEALRRLSTLPVEMLTTPAGLISTYFVEPVVLFTVFGWSIARGSDAVSGELSRGTLELLLAQPIRRIALLAAHFTTNIIGSILLALGAWLGLWVGTQTVTLKAAVPMAPLAAGAVNLFSLALCIACFATMVSCCDRYRWRTIGISGGFVLSQIILKMVARMWPAGDGLKYLTLLTAYEPQIFLVDPKNAWALALRDNLILLGLSGLFMVVGVVVFARRDLPAPL